MRVLEVKVWDLPAPWKDRWHFAPGSFAWKHDGVQWVPILTLPSAAGFEIGRARLFERDSALFAELHFRDEFPVLAGWLKKLPKSVTTAGHDALKLRLKVEAYQRQELGHLVTHADALAVAVYGFPDAVRDRLERQIDEVSPARRRKPDPDGQTIADWLKEQEEAQDRNG